MADRIYQREEVIGERFILSEPLGKGAFGAVWKATDKQNGDVQVAVKLLFDKYRRDRKMMQRFLQEAKLTQRLQHAGIARSIAWDGEGPDAYMAMELIDGETLDQKFEGNSRENSPIPKEGVAWICDQLCAAVGFAHKDNVVHRDLKPRNVMVNRRGARPFVKVLDFGIAKILVGSEIDPTTIGRVLGSVLYISPEQVLGKPLDHRADIFSLGTIMFELITLKRAWARDENGRPHPFHKPIVVGENNSHVAVLRRIAREGRPRATAERRDISPAVDVVLAKAMSIKAEDRYQSADEFAKALRLALLEPGSVEAGVVESEGPTLTIQDKPSSPTGRPLSEISTQTGTLAQDTTSNERGPGAAKTELVLPPVPAAPRPQLGMTASMSGEPVPDPASEDATIRPGPSEPDPVPTSNRGFMGGVLFAAAVLIALLAYFGLKS